MSGVSGRLAIQGLPLLAFFLSLGGCAATVDNRTAFLGAATSSLGDFYVPVQSMEDRRFSTVVRQRYDFSCGSAALATLLHFHYGDAQTEEAVFQGMWRDGDREAIRRVGFSLLDMKRYLAARGLRADGFRVTLKQIADAGVPGIVLINVRGYRHFVVVKGLNEQEVLVGDPSLGLRVMSVKEFAEAWNGIYFALNSNLEQGRTRFNRDAQWAAFSRAPIGGRFLDPVSMQALMLTAPFYRDF